MCSRRQGSTKILPPASPTETNFSHPVHSSELNYEKHEEVEESLSLEDREKDFNTKSIG